MALVQTVQLLWLLLRSAAACQCNRKLSLKLWSQIMFSLASVVEKLVSLSLSFSLSLSHHPNWLPVWTTSCRKERKLWLQSPVSGGCGVCQTELRKEGWGSIWVDYWLFSSPPSLPRSVFLSIIHLFLFLLLHSILFFLACLPRRWMESIPWKFVKSRSLSGLGKLKCLSQLLGMKGFRGALGWCKSNGIIL